MKKLLIEYANNKFINNITLSHTNFCDKLVTPLDSQLYKVYYQYQCSDLILVESLLSNEKYQFIEEFGKNISIYIYRDIFNQQYNNISNIKGFISKNKFDSNKKILPLPVLVNNEIFKTDNKIIKNNDIVAFIDNIEYLPQELNNYLYPSSKLPIKMFNNSKIIHSQNLGIVSESDKANILQKSKYYLALDTEYVPEAWSCSCVVLDVNDLSTLEPTKFKYSSSFQSYSNFLKGLLSAK